MFHVYCWCVTKKYTHVDIKQTSRDITGCNVLAGLLFPNYVLIVFNNKFDLWRMAFGFESKYSKDDR